MSFFTVLVKPQVELMFMLIYLTIISVCNNYYYYYPNDRVSIVIDSQISSIFIGKTIEIFFWKRQENIKVGMYMQISNKNQTHFSE